LSAPLSAGQGVVLLHGLARSETSMEKLESALLEEGFRVLNVAYPSRTATIAELSATVIGGALTNPVLAACDTIHFVTHSLGGILVRYYFAHRDEPRLGRVVMLGPPNQGSEVVDTIGEWWIVEQINGPAGRELGTTTNATPNRLGPVTFELGIIAGDLSINAINSLMIPGPDDGKVSVERTKVSGMKEHVVIHATHPYLMKNDEAISLTLRFLKTGSFRAP
jgi:pimeloyl-ACP methyl ester carboxylesterase